MANNSQSSSTQVFHPPAIGSMGSQSFGPSVSMPFRPVLGQQQGQPFFPIASQQFQHVGQGVSSPNVGIPSFQNQIPHFSQPMQQLPQRPSHAVSSLQATPIPFIQQNRPFTYEATQSQPTAPPLNNHMPGLSGPGLSLTYTFVPSSFGQHPNNVNTSTQYQPITQMHAPVLPVGGQPWLSSGNQSTLPITPPQPLLTTAAIPVANVSNPTHLLTTDWLVHAKADGKKYYYNKKTRQSSWVKPLELMTPIERADATTDWKEFTAEDGRKYYYNKATKQSVWKIPAELKLARQQVEKVIIPEKQPQIASMSHVLDVVSVSLAETPSTVPIPVVSTASTIFRPILSPTLVALVSDSPSIQVSGPTDIPTPNLTVINPVSDIPRVSVTPLLDIQSGSESVSLAGSNSSLSSLYDIAQDLSQSLNGATLQDIEEAKKGMAVAGKVNVTPLEDKIAEDEPLVYANKQEAKYAFKALLESANVESDWNWDQAMRVIINDKRYGALKGLGERKQAFNEYVSQRKKLEAEERRARHKKAREEFVEMLEESKELTSSTRWSKALTMFEEDIRFQGIERSRDREDLFQNYMSELQEKEKMKAREDFERNKIEYRKFLESCDYIKANSQWRKLQDRLEVDERCYCLEKITRVEVFQEYLNDLDKEEEEQRKMQKEQLRKTERKNRDEFRKLMEGHTVAGTLTAKTHWREYCTKVKDLPQYIAVASNTSGATPKDLFEDVAEELEKQTNQILIRPLSNTCLNLKQVMEGLNRYLSLFRYVMLTKM